LFLDPLPSLGEGQLQSATGEVVRIPFLRIFALAYFGGLQNVRHCIVDTGAALSVFPQSEWMNFVNDIEWLQTPNGVVNPDWVTNVAGATGGSCPCRLGYVRAVFMAFGGKARRLPPLRLLGQFLLDGGLPEDQRPMKRIVLGLYGGCLQGRRLIVDPDSCEAWLQEKPRRRHTRSS
jgi:hypothetical protein